MEEKKSKVMSYEKVYTEKQQKDSYDLWKLCFGDTREYMDNYFAWRLKENQILSLYSDEAMTSMIHLNPYPLILSGKEIQTNYIVGVATRPEYRKQGLMRKLLTKALEDMYEEGHEFTWLMPASDKIYLPFDFRYIYEQQRRKITINKDNASVWSEEKESDVQAAAIRGLGNKEYQDKIDQSDIYIKVLDSSNSKEITRLISFVNKVLDKTQEIFAKRDEHYYKRLQADMESAGGNVLIVYNDKRIIGCVSYMLEGNYAEITESVIRKKYTRQIVETVVKAIAAKWTDKKDSIKNDKNTDEVKDNLEITFLESEFMDESVLDDFHFNGETKPIIMARIVNVPKFMKGITAKEPLSIIIKIEDPILDGNHNIWEFNFQNKIGESYFCEISSTDKIPEIVLDIGNFTEIFMGHKKITELEQNLSNDVLEKLKNIKFFHKIFLNEIV
ncbi:putative acetyltransferase [Mobilisporobacter senegalensis]|uniref:Putative acetyltransferase n=1 Tax=Mobilisporobacter senegalensis TaxID=1329262 RepID=A0A3N1XHW7_9FIRM|nr:GNAT family N-acetyltransferase [Mobilisporobacter senegalensis]ROR26284.1 putative acetyltransferase [Mobilisporobacter senegalensis]